MQGLHMPSLLQGHRRESPSVACVCSMLNLVIVLDVLQTSKHMSVHGSNAASYTSLWLEELLLTFCAYPAWLHLDLAAEKSQCSLSASFVARGVAADVTAYLQGIFT